jgi:uncharacterized RDD family membrane protein YckC
MKTIEINTSQNVPIEYEVAKLGQRIGGQLIDLLVVVGYSFFASIIMGLFGLYSIVDGGGMASVNEILLYIVVLLPVTFYSLLNEIFFKGQSIGKKAAGMRVIKTNGENATYRDYTMRWVFRIVDLWMSCGGLGGIFISATDKGQRLGDMVSGTVLIRLRPSRKYTITEILTIRKRENHDVLYPEASAFTDEDMILIKSALNRVKKYPNSANSDLISKLALATQDKLGIEELPKPHDQFLRRVLQDYIVITR